MQQRQTLTPPLAALAGLVLMGMGVAVTRRGWRRRSARRARERDVTDVGSLFSDKPEPRPSLIPHLAWQERTEDSVELGVLVGPVLIILGLVVLVAGTAAALAS